VNARQWFLEQCNPVDSFALITGASSGIGLEYLNAFAAMGCKCIATSVDGSELAKAAQSVRQTHGVEVVEIVADLAQLEGVRHLLDTVSPYEIVAVVNNAGFGLKGEFLSHPSEAYEAIIFLNAMTPTLIARRLVPKMLAAGRGLVLHVASINAITPIAYNAVYTATKAYILYYAYAIAYELRHSPLIFQIVLPGTTKTPFHKRQGAVPQSMYMTPDVVVERSLSRIDRLLCISNKYDRILYPIVSVLPLPMRIRLATYLLKRRLKLGA
jgi:short-subunit dehydrogenase